MNKHTDSSLFISPSLGAIYRQLLAGVEDYTQLGDRIVEKIKAAQAFRQVEAVRDLARILVNFPLREYRLIARYYLVWCRCRELRYHKDVLERIIDLSQTYKSKGLLSRGAFEFYEGNYDGALLFYTESLKANPSVSDFILAAKEIAVIKSLEGFRQSARRDLEGLVPLLKHAEPFVYYDVLNSYAVVLKESNCLGEARNAALTAFSSPFAPYYFEWRETLFKINERAKKRSTVHISIKEERVAQIDDGIDAELAEMFDCEFLPGIPQPFHQDVAQLIDCFAAMGPRVLMALVLKLVLRNRITDKEIHLICDLFYGE